MGSAATLNFKSEVCFLQKIPGPKRLAQFFETTPECQLVIYDKRLAKREDVKQWLKEFRFTYAVQGGEKLKDLKRLSDHIEDMFKILGAVSPHNMCVVALGGGTVGDFAGFVASIFKRGIPLIHIPSTIISAIDSSHGGKTALNVGSIKNQVGSFHPAKAVVIVKDLFAGLPKLQIQSGVGELIKMALISGGELYSQVTQSDLKDFESFWQLMPATIEAKYKIVATDPFETKGERQVLNLGHTMGHVLESRYELPHGIAVGLGLQFAIRWSQHRGYITSEVMQNILRVITEAAHIPSHEDFFKSERRMSVSKLIKFVAQDKKMRDSSHIHFIFVEGVGSAYRKSVTLDSFLTEAERQGWVE